MFLQKYEPTKHENKFWGSFGLNIFQTFDKEKAYLTVLSIEWWRASFNSKSDGKKTTYNAVQLQLSPL